MNTLLFIMFQLVADLLTYRVIQPALAIEGIEIFSCSGVGAGDRFLRCGRLGEVSWGRFFRMIRGFIDGLHGFMKQHQCMRNEKAALSN